MRNKKLIIAIALCITAVFSLLYGILSSPRAKRLEADIQKAETVATEKEAVPLARGAKRTSFSTWVRNPFSLTPIKGYGAPILIGIMWDKENSIAIINGNIVKIGDKVSENTIVDIKQDKVIFNDGSKNFELKLEQ